MLRVVRVGLEQRLAQAQAFLIVLESLVGLTALELHVAELVVRGGEIALGLRVVRIGLEQRLAQVQAIRVVLEGLVGRAEPKLNVAKLVVRDGEVAFGRSVARVGRGEPPRRSQWLRSQNLAGR